MRGSQVSRRVAKSDMDEPPPGAASITSPRIPHHKELQTKRASKLLPRCMRWAARARIPRRKLGSCWHRRPVGAFSPEAKTDAVKPGGRSIDGGRVGSKNAVLSGQSGFDSRRLGNGRQREQWCNGERGDQSLRTTSSSHGVCSSLSCSEKKVLMDAAYSRLPQMRLCAIKCGRGECAPM